jgi:hypothetical protein
MPARNPRKLEWPSDDKTIRGEVRITERASQNPRPIPMMSAASGRGTRPGPRIARDGRAEAPIGLVQVAALATLVTLASCQPSPPPPQLAPPAPPVPASAAPPSPDAKGPVAGWVVLPSMELPPGPIYACEIAGTRTPIDLDDAVDKLCRRHPEMGPCQYERAACRRRGGRVYTVKGDEVTEAVEAEYDMKVRRVRFQAEVPAVR